MAPDKGSITLNGNRGRHVRKPLDHKRLAWIDPAEEQFWEYKTSGGAIVGQPAEAGGVLVVSDDGGRFVGLDPATGRRLGAGYTLRAAVAPAGTPVAFGPGRAFAPLTDGTVLLLPLDQLGEPLPGLPPVW